MAEVISTALPVFVDAGGAEIAAAGGFDVSHEARAIATGLTVAAIYTFVASSGAHVNPAITLAFAARGAFPMGCGATIVACVMFARPVSEASMNPARSFGPALVALDFHALWIYILAPAWGALLAVLVARVVHGPSQSEEVEAAAGEKNLATTAQQFIESVARGRQARRNRRKSAVYKRVNEHFKPVFDAASRPRSRFSTNC